jgi:hypothetical protein
MATNNLKQGDINTQLLSAAIRFNAIVLGLVCGIVAALAIYLATRISLSMWGDHAGGYLSLLSVFFPGYTPTPGGAFIGAFWAFVFTGFGGSLTYWWYGRLLGKKMVSSVSAASEGSDPIFKPAILRFSAVPLGVAIGSAMGGALFLSTSFLVIRGTADSSVHAALLANYLPGYTVSFMGGMLGAGELFLFVFISCVTLAVIYNKVVDIRQRKA